MRDIKFDGSHLVKKEEEPAKELNEDELAGYILRVTTERSLTFEDVQAVLDAETEYLRMKGFIEN